jgi:hypothetical protein
MAETSRKVNISIYVEPGKKEAIEEFFLDCRIKNFQEGYRDILDLGVEEFKKLKKVKGEKYGV